MLASRAATCARLSGCSCAGCVAVELPARCFACLVLVLSAACSAHGCGCFCCCCCFICCLLLEVRAPQQAPSCEATSFRYTARDCSSRAADTTSATITTMP